MTRLLACFALLSSSSPCGPRPASRTPCGGTHLLLTWGLCGRVPTSESGQVSVCARAVRGTTARSWPPQAPGGGLGGWGGGWVRQGCVTIIYSLEKVQCELVGGSLSFWSNLYFTHTTQTLDFWRLVFLAPFSRAVRVADGACYVYACALIWTDVQRGVGERRIR